MGISDRMQAKMQVLLQDSSDAALTARDLRIKYDEGAAEGAEVAPAEAEGEPPAAEEGGGQTEEGGGGGNGEGSEGGQTAHQAPAEEAETAEPAPPEGGADDSAVEGEQPKTDGNTQPQERNTTAPPHNAAS